MFPIEAHLRMLADKTRIEAYRRAIFQSVQSGDVVVDIGTGTGVLAFFALQAGAGRVYAIESGEIMDVARKIAKDNGFLKNIEFIQEDSRKTEIAEPADVLITETIGSLGIDEGIMDIVSDARDRFLKPNGKIIPEGLSVRAVLINALNNHPFLFLEKSFHELGFSHLRELAANAIHTFEVDFSNQPVFLARPMDVFHVDFYRCKNTAFPVKMQGDFEITRKGVFHGSLLFPEITLAKNNTISLVRKDNLVPSHWSIAFLPISKSTRVSPGNFVSFEVTIDEKVGYVWKYALKMKEKEKVFTQLSAFGLPSLKDLKQREGSESRSY